MKRPSVSTLRVLVFSLPLLALLAVIPQIFQNRRLLPPPIVRPLHISPAGFQTERFKYGGIGFEYGTGTLSVTDPAGKVIWAGPTAKVDGLTLTSHGKMGRVTKGGKVLWTGALLTPGVRVEFDGSYEKGGPARVKTRDSKVLWMGVVPADVYNPQGHAGWIQIMGKNGVVQFSVPCDKTGFLVVSKGSVRMGPGDRSSGGETGLYGAVSAGNILANGHSVIFGHSPNIKVVMKDEATKKRIWVSTFTALTIKEIPTMPHFPSTAEPRYLIAMPGQSRLADFKYYDAKGREVLTGVSSGPAS